MNTGNFSKAIIYYFSGTGNAKSVAHWIQKIFVECNIETEVINIAKLENRKEVELTRGALIGFCGPTHGFNFPPIMLHFLIRFPKSNKNKVFVINTRAGMKLGKRFVPGLSGLAQLLSALILRFKGYRIVGMFPVDLPSNWISLHPGLKASVVDSIYLKRKQQTIEFARRLLKGEKIYKALRNIIEDLVISPIAILYYLIGRFFLAKTFIASSSCTNCGICIEKCPIEAIKKVDNRCFWTYRCESCMQCMNNCPERAIETAHGFIFSITFLIYAVILVWIYKLTGIHDIITSNLPIWLGSIGIKVFETILAFFFLFVGYRVMHFLLRFKFFERIFVFTSLTKYKFWRRYKVQTTKYD